MPGASALVWVCLYASGWVWVGVGVSDSDIWNACGCGPSVWVSLYMCAVFVAALLALGRIAGFVAALLAPLLAALGRQNCCAMCGRCQQRHPQNEGSGERKNTGGALQLVATGVHIRYRQKLCLSHVLRACNRLQQSALLVSAHARKQQG